MVVENKINEELLKNIDQLQLSEHLFKLKDAMFSAPRKISVDRAKLTMESWKETEGEPVPLRRAKLFAKVCDGMPVAIFDHELIVGSQTRFVRGTEPQIDFNPKPAVEVVSGDNRSRAENALGMIADEDLKVIAEATRYWQGRTPGEKILQTIREEMGSIYEDISYDV